MQLFKTLLNRELQEHKWGFLYLPWLISIFMSSLILLVWLGLTDVVAGEITFSTKIYENPEIVEGMRNATIDQRMGVIKAGLLVLGLPVVLGLGLSILSFAVSTFFDERKDKSVVFWRSMPVSDTTTVLSKLVFIIFFAPLLILPPILLVHFVALFAASVYFANNEIVPFIWAWEAYPLLDWFRIVISLWVQGLWTLPLISWLMLSSVWSRRPIAISFVPIVVIIAAENAAFSSNSTFEFILERIRAWRASSVFEEEASFQVAPLADIPVLISSPQFILGLFISGLLIALTISLRGKYGRTLD